MTPATTPVAGPDQAAGPDPGTEAARRAAALRRIPYIFRRAGSDSTMQALLRAMVDYQTEK